VRGMVYGPGNERRQAKSFKLTKLFCGEGDSEAATISVGLCFGACSDRTKHIFENKTCVFLRSNKNITGALCYVNKETKWQLATTEL
jgi:uracil-DNA glycosylase